MMLRGIARRSSHALRGSSLQSAVSVPVRCFAAAPGSSTGDADGEKRARPPSAKKERKPRREGKTGKVSAHADRERKQGGNSAAAPATQRPQKKKVYDFSKRGKQQQEELEKFDFPEYWHEDFPEGFDDQMKHEVEKLQIFEDFTPMLDLSWQKEIHPKFDGSAIELMLNCPLEDYDERLFVDDKNTFDTKVVMEVPMECFVGLDKIGLEYVAKLAGPRYNAGKRSLKLTEDRYPKRVYNHKRLCDILRDLTETADKLSQEEQAKASSA